MQNYIKRTSLTTVTLTFSASQGKIVATLRCRVST